MPKVFKHDFYPQKMKAMLLSTCWNDQSDHAMPSLNNHVTNFFIIVFILVFFEQFFVAAMASFLATLGLHSKLFFFIWQQCFLFA